MNRINVRRILPQSQILGLHTQLINASPPSFSPVSSLLFHGPIGSGKTYYAKQLAETELCADLVGEVNILSLYCETSTLGLKTSFSENIDHSSHPSPPLLSPPSSIHGFSPKKNDDISNIVDVHPQRKMMNTAENFKEDTAGDVSKRCNFKMSLSNGSFGVISGGGNSILANSSAGDGINAYSMFQDGSHRSSICERNATTTELQPVSNSKTYTCDNQSIHQSQVNSNGISSNSFTLRNRNLPRTTVEGQLEKSETKAQHSILQKIHSLFSQVREKFSNGYERELKVVLLFEDCQTLFFTNLQNFTTTTSLSSFQPQVQQLNVIPHLIGQEVKLIQTMTFPRCHKLCIMYTSSNFSLFPDELMDVIPTISICVPLPSTQERNSYIFQKLKSLSNTQQNLNLRILLNRMSDDEFLIGKFVEMTVDYTFSRVGNFLEFLYKYLDVNSVNGSTISMEKIFKMSYSVNKMLFDSKHHREGPCTPQARVPKNGSCTDSLVANEFAASIYRDSQIPPTSNNGKSTSASCGPIAAVLETRPDFGDIEAAKELQGLMTVGKEVVQAELHSNEDDYVGNEDTESLEDMEELEEIDDSGEDYGDDDGGIERKRKRKSRNLSPSSKKRRKVKREKMNATGGGSSGGASSSSCTQHRQRWYRSYHGALAYAILKTKSWNVRNNGMLDVHLDSDKKKTGGSVYDWDILWLGMKLIPGVCKNQPMGVNAARKMVKNHETIKSGLVEWRKRRPTDDEELRKIFGVEFVNPDSELEKFMNQHKDWNDEDEEKLLNECRMRAGLKPKPQEPMSEVSSTHSSSELISTTAPDAKSHPSQIMSDKTEDCESNANMHS